MSEGKYPLARIVTVEDEVHIVADAYPVAGGWSFRQPTSGWRWLSWSRFKSTERFIPGKRIREVKPIHAKR